MNVLLPIETINRELDFKLFLSALYVREDTKIYIGQHDFLHNKIVPRINGGIYVGKNLFLTHFPTSLARYEQLKANGFNIVHLDEEGGIYSSNDQDFWKTMLGHRLDVSVLQKDDWVCTWGDFQKQYYQDQRPNFEGNIITTGHPRFELYKEKYRSFYDSEVKNIQAKHGDFILVNTNLTFANNVKGIEDTFSGSFYQNIYTGDNPHRFIKLWRATSINLVNFVTLIHQLSYCFPNRKIILRPHPSEDWSYYKKVFKQLNNVEVIHEGAVGPWILASEILIHDGCTTALEAVLANKTVINFRANGDSNYECYVPNNLNTYYATTVKEIINSLMPNKEYSLPKRKETEVARNLIYNIANMDSFDKLINVMELAEVPVKEIKMLSKQQIKWIVKKDSLKSRFKNAVRPLFPERQKKYLATINKFNGFTNCNIEERVKRVESVLGYSIKCEVLSDKFIYVTK